MADNMQPQTDLHVQLRAAIDQLEDLLPGQAPLKDFVHHNTLHSLQHLPFPAALAESERLTGARGYLTEERFRLFFQEGRITKEDLLSAIDTDPDLEADRPVNGEDEHPWLNRDIYLAALLHPLQPITACQFKWQLEERDVLARFNTAVPADKRRKLLASAQTAGKAGESAAIEDLWAAVLEGLALTYDPLHPEALVDLAPEQAEELLLALTGENETRATGSMMDRLLRKEAGDLLSQLLARVGQDLTLRGLLLAITGHDVLADLQPTLLRQLANYLDQGLAAWHSSQRDAGFYRAWRHFAAEDYAWVFEELPDWHSHLESLPDDPMAAIIMALRRLGLRQSKWVGYLQQLALELPGWSGMVLWRQQHPGYAGVQPEKVEMIDYLAVRLVLEHLYAQRLCAELWQVEASLDTMRWYFRHHGAELLVRFSLYNDHLPEYLASLAQHQTTQPGGEHAADASWGRLAQMIQTWRGCPDADRSRGHSVYRSGWRLFNLAQHLGLSGAELRKLDPVQLNRMLNCIDRLTPAKTGYLWLQAYEWHYRDLLLGALAANHGRQTDRNKVVSAQLVFCMDDREEGTRRHLEEVVPCIETFGAAAHFGVPNYWRSLDAKTATPLTPTSITPVHEVKERPAAGQAQRNARHTRRIGWRLRLENLLHQELRRNLLSSALLILLTAPAVLLVLVAQLFAPFSFGRRWHWLRCKYDLEVTTEIDFCAETCAQTPTPGQPRRGFTDDEQLTSVETLLRNIGLTAGFAPLIVIMGHGSKSQNNPHLAAYDCGACSGRHSGPNARILAAMANRPQVRQGLAQHGIEIPHGTWFIGAEHNTCSEAIEWYDLHLVPEGCRSALERLQKSLDEACRRHAQERCRRFASAPPAPTPEAAQAHVSGRGFDLSQTRPELGHATNAAAFIGRRDMSQGLFLDRRVFLISYNATSDATGAVLERLLLANAPVGAGISLEYYFSTVDNERYGAGSKITHNVTGLFGVMDGGASDLRTGLPLQMVEIHEAMRIQVVVEAAVKTLSDIYARQPMLQALIGNGWLLLSAMDPASGALSTFDPQQGFIPWQQKSAPPARVPSSHAWYRNQHQTLAPAIITGAHKT